MGNPTLEVSALHILYILMWKLRQRAVLHLASQLTMIGICGARLSGDSPNEQRSPIDYRSN